MIRATTRFSHGSARQSRHAARIMLLAVTTLLASATSSARDPGPESGPQIDSIERARVEGPRLAEQCRRLTEEVKTLGELREEYELLKSAGNVHMREVTVPGSSALMHDRIQELKRKIREREAENPGDPALRDLKAEHNKLHDDYTAQMTALIAGDSYLTRRGVRDYASLVTRYGAAKQKWEPQQSRYPQAQEEKDRICAQARQAEELIAAGSCDIFNRGAQAPAPHAIASDSAGRGLSPIMQLLGIAPAHAIGTAPGEIAAYVRGETGLVCMKRRGGNSWNRIRLGQPIEVGDTVRTGKDGRLRFEFADRDEETNAGPSVMNLAPETELVMEGFFVTEREMDRDKRRREGLISLIKGEIRAFMKGWSANSSVNVRAGVTICGTRGTEFVLSHAPATGQVDLKVADGKVEFSTPQGKTLVGAGQMASAKGPALGPVTAMPAGVWKQALAASEIKTGGKPKPTPTPQAKAPVAAGTTPQATPYRWGCTGQRAPCITVRYAGRDYETEYYRQTNASGLPIDTYYYPLRQNGQPVFQGGEQVWERFARVPAADHTDQSNAQMYHVTRTRQGEAWVERETAGARFEVMMTAPHVQATQPPPGTGQSPPAVPPAGR